MNTNGLWVVSPDLSLFGLSAPLSLHLCLPVSGFVLPASRPSGFHPRLQVSKTVSLPASLILGWG